MARAVRDRLPEVYWSVSVTTRPPRPGETEGEDYSFVSSEAFNDLMLEDAFLEWAEVYGNRYGTLAHPVEEARQGGRTALLELDVQGALAVKARIPDAVLVFLVPRDQAQLEERLRARGTESEASLRRRLEAAREEMDLRDRFDHVVVNDVLAEAVDRVAAILEDLPTNSEEPS